MVRTVTTDDEKSHEAAWKFGCIALPSPNSGSIYPRFQPLNIYTERLCRNCAIQLCFLNLFAIENREITWWFILKTMSNTIITHLHRIFRRWNILSTLALIQRHVQDGADLDPYHYDQSANHREILCKEVFDTPNRRSRNCTIAGMIGLKYVSSGSNDLRRLDELTSADAKLKMKMNRTPAKRQPKGHSVHPY